MHPVLFRIPFPGWSLPLLGKLGIVPIYSYGVMLGLSLVVGWYLTLRLCEKDGLDREEMANCYVLTAVVALLGSRWMYLLTNLDDVHSFADLFSFRGGGLVAYGGFLGGFLGSFVFMRVKGKRLLPWADAAVPSLASGLAITRVGCYLFGCDYGRPLPSDAPAFLARLGTFPRWPEGLVGDGVGSPAWDEHVRRKLIEPQSLTSAPVHPTQLYEALVGVLLLVLLFRVRAKRRFRGEVFFVATFVYGLLRFLLELVRDDPERGNVPFSLPSHLLWPLCLMAFAIAFTVSLAHGIRAALVRRIARFVSFVPAIAAAVVLRPEAFATATRASLSTSQAIGLGSALAVSVLYFVHHRAAEANPAAALALEVAPPRAASGGEAGTVEELATELPEAEAAEREGEPKT